MIFEGNFDGRKFKIGIVVSRFNEIVSKPLLEGALSTLKKCGVDDKNCSVAWVPGAFEIPLAAQQLFKKKKVDAVIALGCVIRGATPHFDYVCSQVASGLNSVSLATEKPVGFGVLTTDTLEQAIDRSGAKSGNKGAEAALTVIEMLNLLNKF